ncbi:DUF2153 domain-containing protein [Candidatus Bathyarchaeota archaeon]|nr:DUF2153 domain-containing protein [Candidatus Bathyarchaeota archaeon]
MSVQERWITDCQMLIDHIKKLGNTEGQDRLDMVRTIRFILFALQRSVSGWTEWINNPDIMAGFSLEGLKEITVNLAKLTQTFIDYDSKITLDAQKNIPKIEPETRREVTEKPKDKTGIFYIK